MNQEEIISKLREPFTSQEIEWKIQVTTQDKARGMAVAYLDARAVQKRLDEVVGPFNWRNEYLPWQDKAQICGLSIFNSERGEWIAKYDGADNSDIEAIKGGLTDAFKRSAVLWGIGRYLYQFEGVWVEVEQRGKGCFVKENQYARLETEYNKAVAHIFGSTAIQSSSQPAKNSDIQKTSAAPVVEYKVHSCKPSGKSSQLIELVDNSGEVISAYVKNGDSAITVGSCLRGVKMEAKESSYGPYNLISAYQIAA